MKLLVMFLAVMSSGSLYAAEGKPLINQAAIQRAFELFKADSEEYRKIQAFNFTMEYASPLTMEYVSARAKLNDAEKSALDSLMHDYMKNQTFLK